MGLTSGTRLGAYEILAPLGAGGMGEVYKARDSRLGRQVAVKVLPSDLTDHLDRRARFEREARTSSSLNHPHIVTVHEIGTADGVDYLVMELVDGATLRELLLPGAMPLKKALPLAAQVADGLAKAHEAGLIHRDLKPENLMVTRDGYAKILDFGLAKEIHTSPASTQSPTAAASTASGAILGTVGYMSPEQAAGRPADFRTDIFAFGCVLYEMVTGRRAFQEDTAVDTLAAILHKEPAPLPLTLPEPVRWIVERCLAKDREERYAATRDLARDLQLASRSTTTAPTALDREAPRARPRTLVRLGLAAAVLLLAAAGAFLLGRSKDRTPGSYRMLTLRRGTVWSARFAPGGGTVIYGAAWDGSPVELFAGSDKERGDFRSLGHGAADVFSVSPSGELALALNRRTLQGAETTATLARATLAGGAAREVLEDVREAEFLHDGSDLLIVREEEGKVRLKTLSGNVVFEAPGWISCPRVSPTGRHVAFLSHPVRRDNRGQLVILDLKSREVVSRSEEWPLVHGVAWRPGGEEVWYSPVWRIRAMSVSGKERLVASYPAYVRLLDIDANGRVLLAQELPNWGMRGLLDGLPHERELSWLDQSYVVDVSLDGRSLLFTEYAASDNYGVFFRRSASAPAVMLGEGSAMGLSPDGKTALALRFDPASELVLLPTGTGSPRTLPRGPIQTYVNACFFPDGARVLFWGAEKGKGLRYYVQPIAGGAPRAITPEGTSVQIDANPISPDGRFVAASLGEGMALFPVEGGEPIPVAGVERGEQAVRFHEDGRLFVAKTIGPPPVRVMLVDTKSGKRTLWRELQPDNLAGVGEAFNVSISPNGRAYAYSYPRKLSIVFLTLRLE